jgi:hypothetical protein
MHVTSEQHYIHSRGTDKSTTLHTFQRDRQEHNNTYIPEGPTSARQTVRMTHRMTRTHRHHNDTREIRSDGPRLVPRVDQSCEPHGGFGAV